MAPWGRRAAAVLVLAAPPVVVTLLAWPDPAPRREDPTGEAFVDPVNEVFSADVGDATVRLRPDPSGVCLEVQRGNSSSAGCGPLADQARFPAGGSGTSDGRTSTFEVVGLARPEAETLVVTLEDGTTVDGLVVDLPGRPERVYFATITMAGDAFGERGVGLTVELLDADGDVLEHGEM